MPSQKKVQFSQSIEFISTFGDDEYGAYHTTISFALLWFKQVLFNSFYHLTDRTCLETTPCTYKDMFELLQLRMELRKQMERMLSERDAQDAMNDTDYASSTSSPATSTSSSYDEAFNWDTL